MVTRQKQFAELATAAGLSMYPDPTGERYLYKIDGRCAGKKGENTEFMDDLWDALARAEAAEAENARLQSIVDALPGLVEAQAAVARKHQDNVELIEELESDADSNCDYIDELLAEINELEGKQ